MERSLFEPLDLDPRGARFEQQTQFHRYHSNLSHTIQKPRGFSAEQNQRFHSGKGKEKIRDIRITSDPHSHSILEEIIPDDGFG